MKLQRLTLTNFRGYLGETTIDFDDLTAFVGKNDVGKSTILEALDVFFNDSKAINKLEKQDLNVEAVRANEHVIRLAAVYRPAGEDRH